MTYGLRDVPTDLHLANADVATFLHLFLAAIISPFLHQSPTFKQQVTSPVGSLNLAATFMCQTQFANFSGKFCGIGYPSRNVERKPCTVMSLRPMRRSRISMAMPDSGRRSG